MSANALLKRFDIVADQPANIPALRRLVVDLAVRGKLLAVDELDMDVQEMLRRISSKTDDLVSAGAIKKQKHLPNIGDDEIPAAYLAHCTFARLGNIANLQKGLTGIQSSTPGEFPLVVTSAERGTCDHFDFDGAAAIIPLVSSTGHGNASINRLHYQEGKFALGTILCAVFPFDEQLISARFLYEYLTAFKEELLVSKMIGTANVTLTLGKIAEVPVPILAPAVQMRVDELMALCDQLESAQHERDRRRDRLAAASLQRLNQPAADTTPEAQREYARFYLHHLPRLTTRPEHIKAMRQTILNCAVAGRLVSQHASDESAFDLKNRIAEEKKRLLVTRGAKTKPSITEDEKFVAFDLPRGWSWQQLDQLAWKITDGDHLTPQRESSGRFLLSARNVLNGRLDLSDVDYVGDAEFQRMRGRCDPEKFDVLISCSGSIGRVAIVDKDDAYVLVRSAALVKLVFAQDIAPYIAKALLSDHLQAQMAVRSKAAAQPNLFIGSIRQLMIPIPPLTEQRRIVAKVDELMALCDQLEAQLSITQTDSHRLLAAVLSNALLQTHRQE